MKSNQSLQVDRTNKQRARETKREGKEERRESSLKKERTSVLMYKLTLLFGFPPHPQRPLWLAGEKCTTAFCPYTSYHQISKYQAPGTHRSAINEFTWHFQRN